MSPKGLCVGAPPVALLGMEPSGREAQWMLGFRGVPLNETLGPHTLLSFSLSHHDVTSTSTRIPL